MNVKEGLEDIRTRLIENRAEPASVKLVDAMIQRASLPAASGASANSLLQLTRMLMRTPVADQNAKVYNDFVKIEANLEERAEQFRADRAVDESKPLPKLHKDYKKKKD